MSLIQPTVRRFPKTAETLADSNLPFSVVLTPFHEAPANAAADDGDDPSSSQMSFQKEGLRRHHQYHYNEYPVLSSIPKCMRCGAPHPTKETHFWPYPYSLGEAAPSALVCFLCGGRTSNDQLPPPRALHNNNNNTAATRHYQKQRMPQIYQVPLVSTPQATHWSLPASSCPPICWFLLDGSCTHRSYWTTMSHVLLELLQDNQIIPPHVHIGILLGATVPSTASEDAATTLSYLDLTSPTPHVRQFVQYAGDAEHDEALAASDRYHTGGDSSATAVGDAVAGGLGGLLETMALVPADSLHLPNLHAALRSLVDYDPSQLATTQRAYTMSMPLGTSIETILDFMDQAQHPGAVSPSTTTHVGGDDVVDELWYAGGKIMAFLASCPTDLRGDDWRPLTQKALPQTTVGLGGFGGAVQKTGISRATTTTTMSPSIPNNGGSATSSMYDEETGATKSNGSSPAEILDIDMTPSSLLDYYRAPENAEDYFSELGSLCAEAALGVDIFVMVQPKDDDGDSSSDFGEYNGNAELDVGLPFLRQLSDRSGAPGPLVFPLHQGDSTPITANPHIQRFKREVNARVPWRNFNANSSEGDEVTDHTMAFGGELRLRLSPSYEVDRTPVEKVDHGPQLAPLYSSGGIMGPATEEEESGDLWRLGTCDRFTSVTIDLDMKENIAKDLLKVDGMGQISWKPVLQTCFAYTTIVQDPEHPGEYLTVRQMRIASVRVPLTDSVETLYSSIDPDAIATVLFHKLTLTLLRDGLFGVQSIGEDWLKSLLICAYKSAETQEAIQRDKAEHGLPEQEYEDNGEREHTSLTFYANERLLDREGELTAEDVLLAQGHELLKTMPLVVYSLLQCDAIRPSSLSNDQDLSSGYCPTMDSRCAAGAQMSSMIPPVLARCISPRLQLWSCSEGLILSTVDLQMQAIMIAVEEFGNDPKTGKTRGDLVLFLDSPDCIVVCAASYFYESQKPSRWHKKGISVGPQLERVVDAAVKSYRTAPDVIYDLNKAIDESSASIQEQGYLRILASLVEDLPGKDGARNFKEWANKLAGEVHV